MQADAAHLIEGIPEHVYRRRWFSLGVLCLSLVVVIVGNTSLNVAIPRLNEPEALGGLGASITQAQWMVEAYSLVFAGLLLSAGSLGDRFGRKGALQLGLFIFAIGALFAAFSGSPTQVIAARGVMGVGAAFVMPSTLSILTNIFPAAERPKAIAIWAGISASGAALGPLASGFVLEHFWWGSTFLVNIPVITLALVAGHFLVPKSSDPSHAPLDPIGAVLSIVGLSSLVYAIIEAPHHGWLSPASALWFGAAIVGLVLFALWENHHDDPMLDLSFFKDRRFSMAAGGITLTFFAMFGTFFVVGQYLQLVLGYAPLNAAVRMLPMSFVMMAVAPQTPKLVARFGANRVAGTGLLLIATGLGAMIIAEVDTPYLQVLGSFMVLAVGISMTMSPMTTQLMASVPRNKAGIGSAMNDTTRELGGALGVAVLGSLVTSRYASSLGDALQVVPAPLRHIAESGLGGVEGLISNGSVPAEAASGLRAAAEQAFVDGINLSAVIGASVVAIVAIVVFKFLPADYRHGLAVTGPHADPGEVLPELEPELDKELAEIESAAAASPTSTSSSTSTASGETRRHDEDEDEDDGEPEGDVDGRDPALAKD